MNTGPTHRPALVVDGLTRRYGDRAVVDDVSFQVAPGELFGFLGPNGAGKTTTISMLTTLLRPSGGRAEVAGYDVVAQRSDVRRSIGLVFQQSTLDEHLSAEQNLRFHAYAYGVPRSVREPRIDELLTLLELSDRRKGSVRTFSGGMKRRLEIARGLLHRPRVLFLDEPTLGLDPQTRRRIWTHLEALRAQEGLTVFLTTHYMDEADRCDRIAVLDHGRIVGLAPPDALKRQLGGDLVTVGLHDPDDAVRELREEFGIDAASAEAGVSFTVDDGAAFLPGFVRAFSQPMSAVAVRRPTLDDVFLDLTGHDLRDRELDSRDLLVAAGRPGTGR